MKRFMSFSHTRSLFFSLTLFLSLSLTFLLSFSLLSQNEPMKFGKIKPEEIALKIYPKDSDAVAVILCEFGNASVEYSQSYGFQQVLEVHRRIKIFKKEGYDEANVQLPYYYNIRSSNKIDNIKGSTYNEVNGVLVETPIEKTAIFDEAISKNVHVRKFTFPNVKEGSIIEYTYTYYGGIGNLRPWYFQGYIPTLYSEYRARFHEALSYVALSQLTTSTATQDKKVLRNQDYYYTILKDVPAFKREAYMTSVDDYLEKQEYQISQVQYPGEFPRKILSSWDDFTNELNGADYYGRYMKSNKISRITAEAIRGATTPKDQLNAIYNWVKNTIRWNESYDDYTEQSVGDLLEKKLGNSTEINLLLVAMLREAELYANPVLCSTRDHGKPNTVYPIATKFNNTLAYVKIGEESWFLDGISPYLSMGTVSEQALNGEGFMIGEKNYMVGEQKYGWVQLKNTLRPIHTVNANVEFTEDGTWKGNLDVSQRGYEAVSAREDIKKGGKGKFTNAYFNKVGTVESYTIENTEDANMLLKISAQVIGNNFIEKNDDVIYLNPVWLLSRDKCPFKLKERRYPVDFGQPSDEYFTVIYTIPSGYKVEELPKSSRFIWQDGSLKFDYLIENTNGKIKLSSKLIFKKNVFTAEEYTDLKRFFEQIAAKHSEQIVLKKGA
jgi:hypothetical protein